jgi:hypothetical protein
MNLVDLSDYYYVNYHSVFSNADDAFQLSKFGMSLGSVEDFDDNILYIKVRKITSKYNLFLRRNN